MTTHIVIELLATLAIVCGLAPMPEAWEPDPAEVTALAKMISGFESFALACGGAWPPESWLEWLKREATT